MTTLRDAIQAKRVQESGFEANVVIERAEMISIGGSVEVDGKTNYVWVREYSMEGGVCQVFNPYVQRRAGLAVLLGPAPKPPYRRLVIGVDWSVLADHPSYDGDPFLPNHARSHEYRPGSPGADVVDVYTRAWVPMKVYPESGLTVSVAPGRYTYNGVSISFAGHVGYDLSGSQPASGLACLVLVYMNMATGAISSTAGDTVVDSPVIIPEEPTIPANSIPLAFIRLDGSQSSFTEADFDDPRTMWGDGGQDYSGSNLNLAILEAEIDFAMSTHVVGS